MKLEARCPRCGTQVVQAATRCSRCQQPLDWGTQPVMTPVASDDPDYDMLRLVVASLAAAIFAYAGWHLINIRSVGSLTGDGSIFEVFFQGVAFIAWGLAVLSIAVGLRRG